MTWDEEQFLPNEVRWAWRGAYVRGANIVEYPIPATNGQVMLAGDSGLGYLRSFDSNWMPENVIAFRLATGAVQWTVPMTDYEVPIAALEGGGAVLRGDSGALQIVDGNGTVTDGGTLPVANPQYWDTGVWAGEGSVEFVAGPTMTPAWHQFLVGSGNRQRQNAIPNIYADERRAAFAGLLKAYPPSYDTDYEFGGQICPVGTAFTFSGPVSDRLAESVNVSRARCPRDGVAVAWYHTHGQFGDEGPSGLQNPVLPNDIYSANTHPNLGQYVISPGRNIYRYQGPDARNNVWRWVGGRWERVDPDNSR